MDLKSRLALWPESKLERIQLILPFFEKVQILFEAFKGDDDILFTSKLWRVVPG